MAKLVIKKRHTGEYTTTRSDGQVIDFQNRGYYWATVYEYDFYGHNSKQAKTKSELVRMEQAIADDEEAMRDSYCMDV